MGLGDRDRNPASGPDRGWRQRGRGGIWVHRLARIARRRVGAITNPNNVVAQNHGRLRGRISRGTGNRTTRSAKPSRLVDSRPDRELCGGAPAQPPAAHRRTSATSTRRYVTSGTARVRPDPPALAPQHPDGVVASEVLAVDAAERCPAPLLAPSRSCPRGSCTRDGHGRLSHERAGIEPESSLNLTGASARWRR